MEFRLNGGPFDGETVTVSSLYTDGEDLVIVMLDKTDNKVTWTYICPSDEDFDNRELFLSFEKPKALNHKTADQDQRDRWMKASPYAKKLIEEKKRAAKLPDGNPHKKTVPVTSSLWKQSEHWGDYNSSSTYKKNSHLSY